MESQVAKVIPWSGKSQVAEEQGNASHASPTLGPIAGIFIAISDEQLEALAAMFLMNPLRRAMTFEAYLAARGYCREVE